MKILMLIDNLCIGGKERQLVELLKGLSSNKDFEIQLVIMSKDFFYTEVAGLNIKINYLIRAYKKDISIFYKFYKLCKIFQPDIIHTWDFMTSFYVLPVSKLLGIKMINGSIRHGIRLNKISHKLRAYLARVSPYVLANSEAGLYINGLKKNNRHFVLYNGINKKFKRQLNEKIKRLSTNNKYIKNRIVFISVSSLTPYKDYFTVIRALKMLKKSGYNFLYQIIGDGPMKQEITRNIQENGLEDNVKLLGSKRNIEEYLSKADIFVHSSRGEGCSNVILEAMYSGLPVIATDTGGTREIVTSENGLLFEYKNYGDLYHKLKYLIDNSEVREKFSKNSIKIVEKKFTSDIMIKNYIKILNKVKHPKFTME